MFKVLCFGRRFLLPDRVVSAALRASNRGTSPHFEIPEFLPWGFSLRALCRAVGRRAEVPPIRLSKNAPANHRKCRGVFGLVCRLRHTDPVLLETQALFAFNPGTYEFCGRFSATFGQFQKVRKTAVCGGIFRITPDSPWKFLHTSTIILVIVVKSI